ncbi:methionine ABC transporter ATP-binding protein [Tepidimicrobium xylanilyticum]|uniref:D-methionine transport system ATP-binding protein n=1 Tax=Tepidimicrobium xylanilyticum TaxID=1123352 RepID=A0A1H2Q7C6_9FIRM|nr:methionine ABC transporter ATP-binding protein [Tepidimicrobium xylanilyticum]SDW03083.1 D-methionine transport system ATP-binding protein [Tepidimicrobium xylanilyticum]
MIEIKGLSKFYGDIKVLDDISLEIKEGEIYGLVGRSGAGKSTLLRCINRLEDFQSGSLKVDGVEVRDLEGTKLREFRKNIGMIFQNFSLMQRRSVYENIALPMECWGYNKDEIDKRVRELAEVVEITDKLSSKPRELSGGQQQRVAIARALSLNPKILLSDEATSALDPKTTDSILSLLKRINRNLGITIVIVAHQMSVIKRVCDKVSVLDQGKIALDGKVVDVFLHKQDEIREIFGGANKIALPSTGINIRIIVPEEGESNRIISRMAQILNVAFSIPVANIEQFKERTMALFVINVECENFNKVAEFLDYQNVTWEVVENE